MTSLFTALLVFAAFLVGCCVGAFERHDRRITHEAPRTIDLQRIRQWHGERLVREVGNRRRA